MSPDEQSPLIIMPEDAEAFLGRMDLYLGDVDEAIGNGEVAAQNTTTFAPVTAAGLRRWIQTVETFRERLVDSALWECEDFQNRPTARHRNGRFTLSVTGGNHRVGDSSRMARPGPARRKGAATQEAVDQNQGVLFHLPPMPAAGPVDGAGDVPSPGNWFLLYHRDDTEIRREISLPRPPLPDDTFWNWQVRVILNPWTLQGMPADVPDVGGDDVDFDVVFA